LSLHSSDVAQGRLGEWSSSTINNNEACGGLNNLHSHLLLF
jgi:hypothetical protein